MGRIDTEELRNELIAQLTIKHADAARALILGGNEQVLHDMANAVGDRLCQNKWCEALVRTAVGTEPLKTAALFTAVVNECIKADAENEAIKEVERLEAFAKDDPDNCRATPRQARLLAAARF